MLLACYEIDQTYKSEKNILRNKYKANINIQDRVLSTTKRQHRSKISVVEMRLLRWICGRVEAMGLKVKFSSIGWVAPIEDQLRENTLRWIGHMSHIAETNR